MLVDLSLMHHVDLSYDVVFVVDDVREVQLADYREIVKGETLVGEGDSEVARLQVPVPIGQVDVVLREGHPRIGLLGQPSTIPGVVEVSVGLHFQGGQSIGQFGLGYLQVTAG